MLLADIACYCIKKFDKMKTNLISKLFTALCCLAALSANAQNEPTKYNITIDGNMQNGSVKAYVSTSEATQAEAGDEVTLTITPNAGYELEAGSLKAVFTFNEKQHELTLNADKKDASKYTFLMPAYNVTVSANFALVDYKITIDESIKNGTVSVDPADKTTAHMGENVTLKVEANKWFKLKAVTVTKDGALVDKDVSVSDYKFTMPANDVTVSANFTGVSIIINPSENGEVSVDNDVVLANTEVTLTVKADANYELDKLEVVDVDGKEVAVDKNNKFIMPKSAKVTVSATFKAIDYKIAIVDKIANGKVSVVPADKATANYDEEVTLLVAPEAWYKLTEGSLKVAYGSSESLEPVADEENPGQYTFKMPASDVTVSAAFEAVTIVVADCKNGEVKVDNEKQTKGETVTLTINPAEGYQLKEGSLKAVYLVSGKETTIELKAGVDNTYTFTMPEGNVTVSASFELVDYKIAISACTGGAISVKSIKGVDVVVASGAATLAAPTANYKDTVVLLVAPEAWHKLQAGSLQVAYGTGQSADLVIDAANPGQYKFAMPADNVTVSATFDEISIVVEECENGEVEVNGDQVAKGGEVILTIKPDEGYQLKVLKAVYGEDAKEITLIQSQSDVNQYTFSMPNDKVTVSAVFEAIDYAIKIAEDIENGAVSIVPADKATAIIDEVVTLKVEAKQGFKLDKLVVTYGENKEIIPDADEETPGQYTFVMPANEVTVSASFVAEIPTALDNAEEVVLYTERGRIVCDGEFQIFDLLGRNVTLQNGNLSGIYVVKLGNQTQKVVVR